MSIPKILGVVCVAMLIAATFLMVTTKPDYTKDLPEFTINGETDLEGNFFVSFVYTKNIAMLDGKGNVVWSKHIDPDGSGVEATVTGKWISLRPTLTERSISRCARLCSKMSRQEHRQMQGTTRAWHCRLSLGIG